MESERFICMASNAFLVRVRCEVGFRSIGKLDCCLRSNSIHALHILVSPHIEIRRLCMPLDSILKSGMNILNV